MKPHVTPSAPSWWLWLIAALLLMAGLFVSPAYVLAAMGLALVQGGAFVVLDRSFSIRAQTRFAFAVGLAGLLATGVRGLLWLPVIGLMVRVLFSYCGLARMLTLLPWNRHQPLTTGFVRRAFCAASAVDDAQLDEAAIPN